MLFLLIGLMLAASVCVLCLRKNRESLFLLGMCSSLMVQFAGILIFIAKKGGYTQDILRFLFFSLELKSRVQYMYVTLGQIGYMIAIGRYLFPLFLLETALSYSMAPPVRRHPRLKLYAVILPAVTLIVYIPAVFRALTDAVPALHNVIVQTAYLWILAYVGVSMLLLVQEALAITIRVCRRQFICVVVLLAALSGLYLLYCGQDPAQVYRFYSYDYIWNKGLGYLQYAPSMGGYVTLVVVSVICGVLGIGSLLRYTQNTLMDDRENMGLERKFDVARTGASVFVHSIKNQLLANRVLEKHIMQELDSEAPDLSRVRACVAQLHENNELLLSRSEELYRTVKSKSVRLTPVSLADVEATTLRRFARKYPDALCQTSLDPQLYVLADVNYLSDALYNLLTNGWEANLSAGHADRPVRLISRQERLYTVLEVRDEGVGIARSEQRKIFEPFYSSKNSNYSWGMGLYHARMIVKAHLGQLRVESTPGRGTSFFVMLPRCEP